jgi:hypothetical protein
VSVSTGIAIFPDHGSTAAALLHAADAALYRAKARGGDRVEVANGRPGRVKTGQTESGCVTTCLTGDADPATVRTGLIP